MSRILVAWFSAEGNTTVPAKALAEAAGADLFEIRPITPYTAEDLNWRNMKSRSVVEMFTPNCRPAVLETCENIADYDTIFLGFPIWCLIAPTIVNTFLESYDLSGKTIIPFATSGGNGMDKVNASIQPSAPNSRILEGKLLNRFTQAELKTWVRELGL